MERSIQQVAHLTGVSSRTLRHYHAEGIVRPSRIATNGYRYYNTDALVSLQRVLVLRELGLGIPEIRRVMSNGEDERAALAAHLDQLRARLERLRRQIAAVDATLTSLKTGEEIMAESMFDGFDHTEYRDEVVSRWGRAAYDRSDAWWSSLTDEERRGFQAEVTGLADDWIAAQRSGVAASSRVAQDLAERHVRWLSSVPGTPASNGGDMRAYVLRLAEMYVGDERFAANYGGQEGAGFVRDALRHFLEGDEESGSPSAR
ncbi:TipAS antibiotic-recognition domain-containing protein [Rarobacter faecitabidus]|uniref:DNA-binding transcriptional MerR regulator n=1 Tax=Rarobacter faecitabidus TaxID=13243 RepID=A0A542ZUY7_RARFA|nr:MerR family transcriptional regulator [Rarobacter faecitabidus]TQL64131.1 DNA-binding transcriptional MerR regulator [Rarobacter faecitabidus]